MRSSLTSALKPALVSAILVLFPVIAAAQNDPAAKPDFMFRRPFGSIGFKAGVLMPREEGDLFSFVRENLTVDKGDFRSAAVGGVVGLHLASRATLTIDYEFAKATVASESRPYTGSDGLPIVQQTNLSTHNISAGIKLALVPPGRQVGRYAWIPRAVVPYVGGGFGGVRYQLKQDGEFVDENTLRIFEHEFTSADWGPAGHAFGGTDIALARNAFITVEGRYVWAEAPVGEEFVGFNGIDLAGFRMSTGISVSF